VRVVGLDLDRERGEDSKCDEVRGSIRIRRPFGWLLADSLSAIGWRSVLCVPGAPGGCSGPLLCLVRSMGLWAPRPQMPGDASFRR